MIIKDKFGTLHPPAQKRFKDIWRKEIELASEEDRYLYSPDYLEIERQRKKRKSTMKPKRKSKKIKKCRRK